MKNVNYLWLMLVILVMGFGTATFTGCQQTPKQMQYNAELVFTSTVETLITYKEADMIDQGTWNEYVLPSVVQGDALLDSVNSLSEESGQRTTLLTKLSKLTEDLVKIRIGVENADASQPYRHSENFIDFNLEGE